VIPPARPGALIRSGQQGIDFLAGEKLDQGPRKTLARDGEHPLNLCGMSRGFERCETKERVQSRQA